MKYARKVPDFSKMHAKQFDKMESLDQYLDKKKKRMDTISAVEESRVIVIHILAFSFKFCINSVYILII